jgi:oligopeptide transport system ATP-binding protein
MSEYLVNIKNERLSFFTPAGEVKALNDVSLHLKEGEVLGIVGESGSGKSVTAYSLMGLTAYPGRLIGGSIEFNGHQIDQMNEAQMRKIRGNLPDLPGSDDQLKPGLHHWKSDLRDDPAPHQEN